MGEDAVDLIFRASFISLATADVDGLPWCTPLEFACDEDANVYWVSRVDARHCINLRSNPRAALAIFDSGQILGVGRVKGLYAEGPVHELDPAEVDRIVPSMNGGSPGGTRIVPNHGLVARLAQVRAGRSTG